jgi:hypothetical protein
MSEPARLVTEDDDENAIEQAVDWLISTLGRSESTPAMRAALIEARRMRNITRRWAAIPPQPDARRELAIRVRELQQTAGISDGRPRVSGQILSAGRVLTTQPGNPPPPRQPSAPNMPAVLGGASDGSGSPGNSGVPAALGGVPAALGGVPAALGGVPAALGGVPAALGGVPAALGGAPTASAASASSVRRIPSPAAGATSLGLQPAASSGDDAAAAYARRDSTTRREKSREIELELAAPPPAPTDPFEALDALDSDWYSPNSRPSPKVPSASPTLRGSDAPPDGSAPSGRAPSGGAPSGGAPSGSAPGGSANRFLAPHRGQTIAGVPEQREEIAAAIAKARGTNPGLEPVAPRSDAPPSSGAESLLQAARQRAPSALHALLGSVPPPAPPSARASSAVGEYVERPSRALVVPGVTIVRSESTRWAPHPKHAGVHVRQLHRDPRSGLYSAMIKLDRGASLPARRHLAAEELVLLEGFAHVGDAMLRPGDYLRAELGTVSPPLRADEVCTLFVSGSESDELVEGP